MDVNRRCWILITFAAFFSLKLREATCRPTDRAMAEERIPNMVRKQLVSKTGYILAILEDGNVTTKEEDNNYTYVHMNSHDKGLVTIKGEETDYYVCINPTGAVYGSKNMTTECEFEESFDSHGYRIYKQSVESNENGMQNRYLAISRHGNVKTVNGTDQNNSMKFTLRRLGS